MFLTRYARLSIAAAAAMVTLSAPAFAQVNGGFETGDFTGWGTDGFASVVTTAYPSLSAPIGPTEGSYFALLTAGADSPAGVEAFLGLTPGTLSGVAGSAIKQTIFANAGSTVYFDYDFLAHDYVPFDDYAFFSVAPSASGLASVSTVGDYGSTGWKHGSYTFASSGYYTIGFGVINQLDNNLSSDLAVDSVAVTPEPGEYAFFGFVALSVGGLILRARRAKGNASLAAA